MSRLIDADELIEFLKEVTVTDGITFETGFKQILTDIDNQPTAYDLEKVVDELRILQGTKARYEFNGMGLYKHTTPEETLLLERAINIIKDGGTNE